MYTKIPNISQKDVLCCYIDLARVLPARLEKLNFVHRKASILKHKAGEGN